MKKNYLLAMFIATVAPLSSIAAKNENGDPCQQSHCDNGWKNATKVDIDSAMALGERYKAWLHNARTELTTVAEAIALLKKNGFREWQGQNIAAGSRYYLSNRERSLFVILGGDKPVSAGVRIVASHIDSPRIELKSRPLDTKEGYAMFQTNYHGGIKPHQWTNLPLALTGRVDKKNGEVVQISIGFDPKDPVFVIPGLSPHVAQTHRDKKLPEVVTPEDLDPIVATGPEGDTSVSQRVAEYLKSVYNIDSSDFVSAELALVPTLPPRDVGFDKRLIGAYGQDDRASAFASLIAGIDAESLPQTAILQLVDNEETGSPNVTGMRSTALVDLIGELLYADVGDAYRQPLLTRALRTSRAVFADVTPGINPIDPSVWEANNASRLGFGINIKLYGQGFNANSEYIAWTRAALESKNVQWQTSAYKTGLRKGGPAGHFISSHNIDTIDMGMPILSIHTPFAISDKMDLLALKNAIQAMLEYSR